MTFSLNMQTLIEGKALVLTSSFVLNKINTKEKIKQKEYQKFFLGV